MLRRFASILGLLGLLGSFSLLFGTPTPSSFAQPGPPLAGKKKSLRPDFGAGLKKEGLGQLDFKKGGRSAPKKIAFPYANVQIEGAKKAIAFKKFELADLGEEKGQKITPETKIAVGNKQVAAKHLLVVLNKLEEKMSAKGHSLRTLSDGGLKLSVKSKTHPSTIAQQRKHLTQIHKKTTPEKNQFAKANVAKYGSKQQLPQTVKAAQANHEKLMQWRKAEMDKLKNLDTSKFSAAEKEAHAKLMKAEKEPAADQSSGSKHSVAHAQLRKDTNSLAALLRGGNIRDARLTKIGNYLLRERTSQWTSPDSWNWSAGSRDHVEAHFNAKLETHASMTPLTGTSQHTKFTAALGGYVLNHELKFLEFLADFNSSSRALVRSPSGNHVHVSVKALGRERFAINRPEPTNYVLVDETFPFDETLFDITINLLRLLGVSADDLGGVPGDLAEIFDINVMLSVRGEVRMNVGGVLAPSEIGVTPALTVRCEAYGAAGIGNINGRGPAARLRGAITLIDDTLTVSSVARVNATGTAPALEIVNSVHNRLALGKGELNLDWQLLRVRLFGRERRVGGTIPLRWDNVASLEGYLAGPETVRVPLN
jgi:hypothetical protein